jgi:hydroxymethylbilane synthase
VNFSDTTLRIGTRGSLLARKQCQAVAEQLVGAHPSLAIELVVIKTTGDRVTDRPLADLGGKGLFTKEIEQALTDGQIDAAVHSLKDLPVTMPLIDESQLLLAAVPVREDARDVLLLGDGALREMPTEAVVGTSSLRRQVQVAERWPGATFKPLRGNIDTRIEKLRSGAFDAIILAMAGLVRAGLFDPACMRPIAADIITPAAGQGALAVQCRKNDLRTVELLSALNDPVTAMCVAAEREVVRLLDGDCDSPIGVLATVDPSGQLGMRAAVGGRGGKLPVLHADATGITTDWQAVAAQLAQRLEAQGVRDHLHGSGGVT